MASLGEISVGFRAATGGFTRGTATMIAGIDSTVAKLQASANPLARAAGNIAAVGASATKTAARIASVGAALAPIAAAGALVKIGRQSEDFATAMNNSTAIMSGVTPDIREQMTNVAIDVAKQTKFSATEAAEAYFFLASAGLDAAASMGALPQVAQFAQAGNFDLALATDLLTDAQSALGLSAKDAQENLLNMQRVSNVLVKANTLANASVQQFSESLTNKAGAAIKIVGKDIEEGVAVLAAFADQGVKGAEAGTALNIVFRDLQTRALANSATFKQFGIEVFDSAGEMNNIAAIVGQLETALNGMSDETAKATLQQLGFQDKSVAFIQTLLGTSEKMAMYEQAMRDAGNMTAEVAAKQMTPFQAAMNRLSAAWEEFSIKVGTPVMQALGDAITTHVIPAFEGWLGVMQQDFTSGFKPETITDKLKTLANGIGFLDKLQRSVRLIGIAINEVGAWTGAVLVGIGSYAAQFAEGIVAVGGHIVQGLGSVIQALATIADKARGVVPGAGAIADGLQGAADSADGFGASMRNADFGSSMMMDMATDLARQVEEDKKRFRELLDAPLLQTQIDAGIAKLDAMKNKAGETGDALKTAGDFDPIAEAGRKFQESLGITPELNTAGFFDKYNAAAEALAAKSITPEIAPRFTEDQLSEMKPIAERLFEQTRTPVERMQSKMTELQDVFDAGLITPDTFQRALQQLQTEAASLAEVPEQQMPPVEPFKLTEAVDATTSGTFGTFARSSLFRGGTADKQLKATEDVAKSTQNSEKLLDEIKTIMSKQPQVVEAPIG